MLPYNQAAKVLIKQQIAAKNVLNNGKFIAKIGRNSCFYPS